MATRIGLLHLDLYVAQANSLKDKRRIIRSFKDRVARANNVSVAEVGGLDSHRQCVLAVVMVGTDHSHLEGTLEKIVNAAANHRDMVLSHHEIEWL